MSTQKTPADWVPNDSGTVTTVNAGVQRIEQNSTVRYLQDGVTIRVLQPNVVTGKIPAAWTETP